jgi:PAS domain S-box-containing protein
MISNVIIAWALYRFRLFDIVPIARDYVVGHMSDIVFVLDAENRFVDINPAAEQVLGHRNGDVIGHQSNEILSEWAHLVPLLQGEQEKVVEIEVTFENESYYLAVKLTPLYDDQGMLNGRLVVARDISDMKLAEQNLQKHAAQLEAANQELLALSEIKDEFVANVSHELRTPLANLKLYHDLQIK